ncbi:MAG TPA: SGNH/GDSL hydrolase family protein [Solirubrobacteraceae bacterium]|nr:SGNH/GDSL hydrolase family protein [Solirubrobacteraceae bacterium]
MLRILVRRRPLGLAVCLLVAVSPAGGVVMSTVAPGAATAGAVYVALGDSYSAGEGLGPFEVGTDVDKGAERNQCHRSARDAYSVLDPGVVLPGVTSRAFFACSGATSGDMMSVPPQQPNKDGTEQVGQPRQTAMVGPQTKYVSISAGGNDVGFGNLGLGCVEALVNHTQVVRFSSTSCHDQLIAAEGRLAAAKRSLSMLFETLLDRAPQATIVVLGYPRILPASYADVPVLDGTRFCVLDHYPVPSLTTDIGMPVSQARQLDAFIVELNQAIRAAIDNVRRARPQQQAQLRFADSYASSVPHNCKGTTPNATVTAAQLSLGHGLSGKSYADKLEKLWVASSTLHPTKEGEQLFARLIQHAFSTTGATISVADSGGSFQVRLGNMPLPKDAGSARRAFGNPQSRIHIGYGSTNCQFSWPDLHVTAVFTRGYGGGVPDSCASNAGTLSVSVGDGWRTTGGLSVGSSLAALKRLYPDATPSGKKWILIGSPAPWDTTVTIPVLTATVEAGHVTSFTAAGPEAWDE